jgi:hypothetical protein
MPCFGFETTIPASQRVKTVHALDRSATVTGGAAIMFFLFCLILIISVLFGLDC